MKKTACLIVCVLTAMLITSCSSEKESYLSQQVGKVCKVQFKRNALGGGATLPVPPTTDVFNGAAVSLSGTLRAVDRQAVVLDSGTKTYWIPKDCVLLIEVEK